MARLWNMFITKFRLRALIVPLLLILLIMVDFFSFLDLFISDAQNPMLSILMATFVSIALTVMPCLLAIALVTHSSVIRNNINVEDGIIKTMKLISRTVIIIALAATIVLLFWVTFLRLTVINEEGRASLARFEVAEVEGLVTQSNNIKMSDFTSSVLFNNAGFIQHWYIVGNSQATNFIETHVLNDGMHTHSNSLPIAYGYYPGFRVHFLLIILAWSTTLLALLLSAFNFKAYWWHQTLMRIAKMGDESEERERRDREERERKALARTERERYRDERRRQRALERDEMRKRKTEDRDARKALRTLEKEEKQRFKALRAEFERKIKVAYTEMQADQKRAEQDMNESRREMKKVQEEASLEGGILTLAKPKMKKLKDAMECTKAEEIATSAACDRERSERDKASVAKKHLMAELWEDLNCFGQIPTSSDEFTAMCHKEILMRELLRIESNYSANLQDLYGGIKAELTNCKTEMASMATDEVVASQINAIDIDEIIGSYNANPDLAVEGLHLRQWNTLQSRNALLAGFREMMGLQDMNLAS